MNKKHDAAGERRIVTIPNLLSAFRLALIPAMVYAYCALENPALTGWLLVLSGVTDVADGFIARRFHMISDLGKVLDPVADKLTQTAMLVCLLVRYPKMGVPLLMMVVKETFMAVSGVLVICRTGVVLGAQWHGKAATCLLYAAMFLHVFVRDLPAWASDASIAACAGAILLSLALYALRNLRVLRARHAA